MTDRSVNITLAGRKFSLKVRAEEEEAVRAAAEEVNQICDTYRHKFPDAVVADLLAMTALELGKEVQRQKMEVIEPVQKALKALQLTISDIQS